MTSRDSATVDRLTRAANVLLQEAIEIRKTLPPWWRFHERRAALREYDAKMDRAAELVKAAKGLAPIPPPTRNTGKRSY